MSSHDAQPTPALARSVVLFSLAPVVAGPRCSCCAAAPSGAQPLFVMLSTRVRLVYPRERGQYAIHCGRLTKGR